MRRSKALSIALAAVGLGLGVIATIGLTACGSSSQQDSTATAKDNVDDEAAAVGGQAQEEIDPTPTTDSTTTSDTDPTQRAIIYTGSMTLRVANVSQAAAAAIALTETSQGFVSGDTRTIEDEKSQATLVLSIPAEGFTSVLNQLPAAVGGTEESRSVSAQDVTSQIVDLDARIETAQASVDRIRTLLARAESISDITSIESELSDREATLNSLLQRKTKLANLTSYSTITITLLEPEATSNDKSDDKGFIAGLAQGWDAFTSSGVVVLTVLGVLLPWIIAIGLPLGIVIFVSRKARRTRTPKAGDEAESVSESSR